MPCQPIAADLADLLISFSTIARKSALGDTVYLNPLMAIIIIIFFFEGRVPLDGSARTTGAVLQPTDITTSLAHLSDAIGALAQNDTDAAKLLLHLCTQVLSKSL